MAMSTSQRMARVRHHDTEPELILRSALWRAGIRFRLSSKAPIGKPDLVFQRKKVAVFVDGCFWHGCPEHYSAPKTSTSFWSNRLAANLERDRRQTEQLTGLGWTVVRVWEHTVLRDIETAVNVVKNALRGSTASAQGQTS